MLHLALKDARRGHHAHRDVERSVEQAGDIVTHAAGVVGDGIVVDARRAHELLANQPGDGLPGADAVVERATLLLGPGDEALDVVGWVVHRDRHREGRRHDACDRRVAVVVVGQARIEQLARDLRRDPVVEHRVAVGIGLGALGHGLLAARPLDVVDHDRLAEALAGLLGIDAQHRLDRVARGPGVDDRDRLFGELGKGRSGRRKDDCDSQAPRNFVRLATVMTFPLQWSKASWNEAAGGLPAGSSSMACLSCAYRPGRAFARQPRRKQGRHSTPE